MFLRGANIQNNILFFILLLLRNFSINKNYNNLPINRIQSIIVKSSALKSSNIKTISLFPYQVFSYLNMKIVEILHLLIGLNDNINSIPIGHQNSIAIDH